MTSKDTPPAYLWAHGPPNMEWIKESPITEVAQAIPEVEDCSVSELATEKEQLWSSVALSGARHRASIKVAVTSGGLAYVTIRNHLREDIFSELSLVRSQYLKFLDPVPIGFGQPALLAIPGRSKRSYKLIVRNPLNYSADFNLKMKLL